MEDERKSKILIIIIIIIMKMDKQTEFLNNEEAEKHKLLHYLNVRRTIT